MIRSYTKKIKGKIVAICIATTLIMPGVNIYANEISAVDSNAQSVYMFMRFNEKFNSVQLTRSEQKSSIDYPEDYAGAYIDNNDILHINYIENNSNVVKDSIVDDDVLYDPVKFNYNTLQEIYKFLSSNMNNLSINSVFIDEVNNNVNISVNKDQQDNIIQYLKSNISGFSIDSIVFSKEKEFKYTESGGSTLQNSIGTFTLGYNAYQSSSQKYGFVTCGHAVSVGSGVKNASGTVLGKASDVSLGGNLDASFIPYTTQSKKTSESLTGYNITGTYTSSNLITGMNITKYGYTSQLTQGTIKATSSTISMGSNNLSDQVMMQITQSGGDSGGPVVFNYVGPLQPGQQRPSYIIGIATVTDGNGYGYATKAANINSSFGLSTYTN